MNKKLKDIYNNFCRSIQTTDITLEIFGPPLLIKATDAYEVSERRMLIYGQETKGWDWSKHSVERYSGYGAWSHSEIFSLSDFVEQADSVDALLRGYELFEFAKHQPGNYRSPFWKAFRETKEHSGCDALWGNVFKFDYQNPAVESCSMSKASVSDRSKALECQASVWREELEILSPNACVFFPDQIMMMPFERICRDAASRKWKAIICANSAEYAMIFFPKSPSEHITRNIFT